MRKFAMLFVPLFFLFGCQEDLQIEQENDVRFQTAPVANTTNMYMFFDLGELNDNDEGTFRGAMIAIRRTYPVMEYYLEVLVNKVNHSIKIAIDSDMALDADSYYEPSSKTIYFREAGKMTLMNIIHEMLHLVQEFVLEYDMLNSSCQRDIEYEAHIAYDLIKCHNFNRKLTKEESLGYPSKANGKDYLDSIYRWMRGDNLSGIEIELKFNEWINDWGNYSDKHHCKNYRPQLIYEVLNTIRKSQKNEQN